MIDIDASDLVQTTEELRALRRKIPKAFSSALNRTIQGVRTEAVKKVRETYDIKAGDVRQTIRLTKSTPATTQADMVSRGSNIPLIKFKTKPSKPPKKQPRVLKASVKRSGGRPIPGAFVTKVGSHIGVLKRIGRARLPIRELYGPSVPAMLDEDGVSEYIQEQAKTRLEERFAHEVNRLIGGSS